MKTKHPMTKKVGAVEYVFDNITRKWYTRDEFIRIAQHWIDMQK